MMADAADNGCEILVIGGGPAGATISALLAQRGRDVLMLEKSRHPRFHIGESLLPLNQELFERLGVAAEIEAIGMPKYGVEFNAPPDGETAGKASGLEFADAWDKGFPGAYHVRRADFDHILFRNAVRKGGRAIEGCGVTRVGLWPAGGDATSSGGVCWPNYMKTRKTEPRQFLLDPIALCPQLAERLRDATLISPVTATGNYSYSSRQSVGESYILLGDAFAFIDPIFSSGVLLAMHSAFVGADTVET